MTTDDKQRLIGLLTDTHSDTRMVIEGSDLEARIYSESGWRIRDILGHIAGWDRQAAKSLHAFRDGEDYAIPNFDEDATNEAMVHEQRNWTAEQVIAEWDEAREDFKLAVEEIELDKFPGDLLYPWGDERGSIAQLVEYMAEHDIEHRDDIVKAIMA